MQTASAQPAAVLDYATTPRRDVLVRRTRAVVTVLFCMLLCASVGWIIAPRTYRALGYLQVAQTDQALPGSQQLLDVNAVQARQAAAVTGVAAPANLTAATALVTPTPAITPAALEVQPVPQSRLIAVSYLHSDAKIAADVTNALMVCYKAPGVTTIAMATPPAQPQQNRLYVAGGLAVGLLAGILIVALRWK